MGGVALLGRRRYPRTMLAVVLATLGAGALVAGGGFRVLAKLPA